MLNNSDFTCQQSQDVVKMLKLQTPMSCLFPKDDYCWEIIVYDTTK